MDHVTDHAMDHVATGASPVPPKRSKAEPTQPPNSNHSANPTILVIPTQREAPRRNLLSWLAKASRIRQEPNEVNDSSAYTPSAEIILKNSD
jgi:hypothetical protein